LISVKLNEETNCDFPSKIKQQRCETGKNLVLHPEQSHPPRVKDRQTTSAFETFHEICAIWP
jgi:hypothetical protein